MQTTENRLFKRRLFNYYHSELKRNATSSEIRLKKALKFIGIKVIFQKKLGNYFFDLCIKNKKLLIEIDGGYHGEERQQIWDLKKEVFARKCGWKTLRFKNNDVWENMGEVLKIIKSYK